MLCSFYNDYVNRMPYSMWRNKFVNVWWLVAACVVLLAITNSVQNMLSSPSTCKCLLFYQIHQRQFNVFVFFYLLTCYVHISYDSIMFLFYFFVVAKLSLSFQFLWNLKSSKLVSRLRHKAVLQVYCTEHKLIKVIVLKKTNTNLLHIFEEISNIT